MNLINDNFMTDLTSLNQDVVQFDVYDVLVIIIKKVECLKKIKLINIHNVLMMQLSKITQCIFQNSFRE